MFKTITNKYNMYLWRFILSDLYVSNLFITKYLFLHLNYFYNMEIFSINM